jgi:hypothetical protein
MNFFIKRTPIIVPLLFFVLFEVLFFWTNFYFLLIGLASATILSVVLIIFLAKDKLKEQWPMVIQIIILIIISSLFALLLSHSLFYQLYLIFIALFYWYILTTVFRFLYQPRLYQPYGLEKAAMSILFLSLFYLTAELNVLFIFLNISLWLTILPLFLTNLWFYFYFIRANNAGWSTRNLLIIDLLLTEAYLAFSFLPINFHLVGLILAGLNLIILNLWLKEQKSRLPMIQKN